VLHARLDQLEALGASRRSPRTEEIQRDQASELAEIVVAD
jgi:hypothetical protein